MIFFPSPSLLVRLIVFSLYEMDIYISSFLNCYLHCFPIFSWDIRHLSVRALCLLDLIILCYMGQLFPHPQACYLPWLCCSCLENPMDRGAWPTTVHESQKVGHDFDFTSLYTVLTIYKCFSFIYLHIYPSLMAFAFYVIFGKAFSTTKL